MPQLDTLKNNFTAGEVSPLLLGRSDFTRYAAGAFRLENWLVLLEGGVRSRYGTRFVAEAKVPGSTVLLLPFEPTDTQSYVVEAGEQYFRFYTDLARLEVSGTPVEVSTPYAASELRALRTAQANDVMLLAHGSHAPRRLSRTTTTSFVLQPITFSPPPTFEAGLTPEATLTPSATTGSITLTASASVFLAADAQRVITAGTARAVITSVTSGTVVSADVLDDFPDTSVIAAGDWTLGGSPVARVQPDAAGPVGAQVTLHLQQQQDSAPNLVTNGTFPSNLNGWTDHSGALLASGTHDGTLDNPQLDDSTADFVAAGVQPGSKVFNTTDGSQGTVAIVEVDSLLLDPELSGGTDNDFDPGDTYEVRSSGTVIWHSGTARLSGGTSGLGWLEQGISTQAGRFYRLTFDVLNQPLAVQVGSTSQTADVVAEATFPVGNDHEVLFQASSSTTFIQFRNNQQQAADVDNVAVRLFSVDGFRSSDVGRYLRLRGGLVRITTFVNASQVRGEILHTLTSKDPVAAGVWKLEAAAWSDELGWPTVVVLYEGRLYFAASVTFPQTIWGSAVDDLFNFFRGETAEDAVEFNIRDSGGNIILNQIRALMPAENMLALTTRAEYRLIGSGDDPLTPLTPPRVRVQSTYGAAFITPIKVGPALLFVQRQGSSVREMAFQETTQSFVARSVTRLSGHLLAHNVVELTYQAEPTPLVWALRDDGTLLGFTYDLVEEVEGWHHHVTAGTFESLAVIPHPTAQTDQLWCVVERERLGQTTRYIEYFDDQSQMRMQDAAGTEHSWTGLTVDSGVVELDGVESSTISGLDHLEGRTVAIVGDGAVYPPQRVSGGQVTLSVPASYRWAGLPFTCDGETLPFEAIIDRRGTVQRGLKRWVELNARVYQTIGLTLQGERMPFRTPGMPMSEGVVPQTDDYDITPPGGYDKQGRVTFVQDQPLPAVLLGIIGVIDVQAE